MNEAERQTLERTITPKQEAPLDAFEEILATDGITLTLAFKPLNEPKKEVKTELSTHVCLSDNNELNGVADELIALGETIDFDSWVAIDERQVNGHTLNEEQLSNVLEFARTPSAKPDQKSKQDTSLFKIRYRYKGERNVNGRQFCEKVLDADKVYRVEDLNQASNRVVNKGFGPNGADKYDIFLYKGGVNCKHFWERVIFLKKDNDKISVNKAKKMILALEPSERKDAKWVNNPKEVAQIASSSNNHWKLK